MGNTSIFSGPIPNNYEDPAFVALVTYMCYIGAKYYNLYAIGLTPRYVLSLGVYKLPETKLPYHEMAERYPADDER